MKYIVVLCDGMADRPVKELGGKTPMEAAKKPVMDGIAQKSLVGHVKTVAKGLKPGSDVANLSVMGYDPAIYYSGRSPLEAGSIGIDMSSTDVSLRCNLVTVSDEAVYEDKTLIDYCAGDISTAEARELIKYLAEHFDNETFNLYSGVSYRHCLIWHGGTVDLGTITPPHDITGKPVREYLGGNENAKPLYDMMKKSYELLKDHPINKQRVANGLRPANSCWFWGEGTKKALMPFEEKYGIHGSMISAVDLLKGIGKFAGMQVVDVDGATGYIDTNFDGKAQAAINELKSGQDFVYIHLEAPDECGHRHEIDNKVKAIEMIDSKILKPLVEAVKEFDDFRLMILPDHPTPLDVCTHTSDSVPFLIYDSKKAESGVNCFTEATAKSTGVFIEKGYTIMEKFIRG